MNAEQTLLSVKQFCLSNSNDEHIWKNKGTAYQWTRGKETESGMINGVVRKLAGVDASGKQIWTVAGSIKIAQNGDILRFTGLPRKVQIQLMKQSVEVVETKTSVSETVTA